MRIAFMGSPDFAVPALRALHDAGHLITTVYCQPARPAGRGQTLRRCAVQIEAESLGIPVRTPVRLRADPQAWEEFAGLNLDAAVVAAYGLILPKPMLDAPRHGCLNIHASLLPRWRGAAPIHAAILAGDTETGVTIMRMNEGLDTGPMLLRETVPIGPATTTASLHDRLAELGARLILTALETSPEPIPQPADGVTYAAKLSRDDGRIDWTQDAAAIERRVRAFDPWPGTFSTLDGAVLKILAATVVTDADTTGTDTIGTGTTGTGTTDPRTTSPGTTAAVTTAPVTTGGGPPGGVLDDRLLIACGSGALRLTRVQLAGRAAMNATAFLRGHAIRPGARLGP